MAKPKLCLIPASQGSKVFSVLPSDGSGDFDFSRSGSATRINAQGLIETVSSGQSRLNYPLIDGVVSGCPSLLLENSATNNLLRSEEFDNSFWNKSLVSVTANDSISPDGSQNADKIVSGNSTGAQFFRRTSLNYSATDNTFSVFAKFTDDLFEQFHFVIFDGSNHFAYFDVKNGNVVSTDAGVTATIKDYGNGWYRCIATYQTASTTGGQIKAELGNSVTQTGDGQSGMLFWGFQWEVGSYETSYVPTTSSTATRSAETCNNSGDANTFNDSEGVLMVETKGENDGTFNYISLSDGGIANYAAILYVDDDNKITYRYYVGGSGVNITIDNIIVTNFNKIAIKYKANDFAIWVNGIERGTATSGSLNPSGTFNELAFARGGSNNTPFYGNTKQLQYYDSALTDSELEQLTSWTSFTDMANGQLYTIE